MRAMDWVKQAETDTGGGARGAVAGHDIGRGQVAQLIRQMAIEAVARRRRKVFNTRQDPDAVYGARARGTVRFPSSTWSENASEQGSFTRS